MKRYTILLFCVLLSCTSVQTDKPDKVDPQALEWFQDAKFGMFIQCGRVRPGSMICFISNH